jgi:ribosomal protein S18 acetylase RimI-like enzyme
MNINIRQIEPFSDSETVRGIVEAYRRTFGGEPWNEGYVCPVCGDAFPLAEARALCPPCAARGRLVLLVDYWPASKVTADFYREMMKPEALCLTAKEGDRVVGFIWGYRIVADEHVDDYLEASGLSRLVSGEFFYLDDAAVIPEYQRKGIGKELVARMLRAQPQKNILGRTLDQFPDVPYSYGLQRENSSSDHEESGHHGDFFVMRAGPCTTAGPPCFLILYKLINQLLL